MFALSVLVLRAGGLLRKEEERVIAWLPVPVSVDLAPEGQSKRRSREGRKSFQNQICKKLERRKGLL